MSSLNTHFDIEDTAVVLALTGPGGRILEELSRCSEAAVALRGNRVLLSGEEDTVRVAQRFLQGAVELITRGAGPGPQDVAPAIRALKGDPDASLTDLLDEAVFVGSKRRPVVPKTPAQREYVRCIRNSDLTFGIGPAGTGKTYLAMAMAAAALSQRQVKRVVLTRPAVEAGERLGFLPGDLQEKVSPYLRPLYDALNDMLDFEKVEQLRERGQIEVAPLAFMRGRTLNNAFIILDEAQNATCEQMRMFLTRLGFGSRAVVTGDITQSDLPPGAPSGLKEAEQILARVSGISCCHFSDADVVRHPLVQRIVVAYERSDQHRLENGVKGSRGVRRKASGTGFATRATRETTGDRHAAAAPDRGHLAAGVHEGDPLDGR